MTATELSKNTGKEAEYHIHDQKFTITVRIVDSKMAYGSLRYKIEAVKGTGSTWVSDARLTI